jgi:hypothetical protein
VTAAESFEAGVTDGIRRLGCVACGQFLDDEFTLTGRDDNGELRGRCSPGCTPLDLGRRIYLHKPDGEYAIKGVLSGTCSTLFGLEVLAGEHGLAAGEVVVALLIDEDGNEVGRRTIVVGAPAEERSKRREAVESMAHAGCQPYTLWLLDQAAREERG